VACCVLLYSVEVLAYHPLTAVAPCKSMREAQRSRYFPLRFSRTVDVKSILNVLPRHAAKYNLQVKSTHAHSSQYVEHQTGLVSSQAVGID
jgi:hypothetical protein